MLLYNANYLFYNEKLHDKFNYDEAMTLNKQHPKRHEITFSTENQRIALCRCWQSKQFPYCDGSHRAYCEKSGDTLGPVIVTLDDDQTDKA